ISSNIERQVPKSNACNEKIEQPQVKPLYPPKKDQIAEPVPYTLLQTYADRLRYNQAKSDVPISLTIAFTVNIKQKDLNTRGKQQEDHWQTQRKKNTNQQQSTKESHQADQQHTSTSIIISIPTHNPYTNLDVRETHTKCAGTIQGKGNTNLCGTQVHHKNESAATGTTRKANECGKEIWKEDYCNSTTG
ncbi:hypothetical protein H5410_042517, partial [Solanum commersonii]